MPICNVNFKNEPLGLVKQYKHLGTIINRMAQDTLSGNQVNWIEHKAKHSHEKFRQDGRTNPAVQLQSEHGKYI